MIDHINFTTYPDHFSVKPSILLKDANRVDRRELLAAQKQYQEDLDRFVDHCL